MPDDSIPPVPLPPGGAAQGAGIPPVEPSPSAPEPMASPPAAVPVPNTAVPAAATTTPPADGWVGPANPTQPSPYAAQASGPPQGLSITSMITGIAGIVLGFFALGFLPALAAVITGHMAMKRQPYAKPFWLTGIITGYVGLAFAVIGFLLFLIALLPFLAIASGGFS